MMETLRDIELTARERAWLGQVVGIDEELHLLLRPRTESHPGQFTREWVMGCVWLLICLGLTMGFMQEDARAGILMLPAWAVGIGTLCWPYMWRVRRQRTLYVITARRVLILEPVVVFFSRTRSFPLREDMVQEVGVLPGGYGNIVFSYAWSEMNGSREERVARQVGFIDIPQVKKVQAVLESAIETSLHTVKNEYGARKS